MRDVGAQISRRVRQRLENEPHLRFQAEQAQAVEQLLRELLEVERSASVVISLPDALARLRSSFHSLPLELVSRIERHASCLAVPLPATRNICESGESIDRLSRFLAELQAVGPAAEIPDDVTEWEADFDLAGLSGHYEKLDGLVRGYRRATRDGEDQRASAFRAEIQGLASSIHGTLATRISKDDLEEQVDHEASARTILAELQEELTEIRRILVSQKGGVLAQWCQALDEQPGLWKKLVEKYAEVRGATCQMAAPSPNPLEQSARYDLVVVDEAARTDPGEILIPLTLRTQCSTSKEPMSRAS